MKRQIILPEPPKIIMYANKAYDTMQQDDPIQQQSSTSQQTRPQREAPPSLQIALQMPFSEGADVLWPCNSVLTFSVIPPPILYPS